MLYGIISTFGGIYQSKGSMTIEKRVDESAFEASELVRPSVNIDIKKKKKKNALRGLNTLGMLYRHVMKKGLF